MQWSIASADDKILDEGFVFYKRKDAQTDEIKEFSAVGPIFEENYIDKEHWQTTRPIFITYQNPDLNKTHTHYFYPLFNYYDTPHHTTWDFFTLIRGYRSKGPGTNTHSFMFFPFYVNYQTGHRETSYRGLFPFAGNIRNFFMVPEFKWVLFPLYGRLTQRDRSMRYYAPFPFIQWQKGEGADGQAFWPFRGRFRKQGEYDRSYAFWPLIYRNIDNLSSDDPVDTKAFLPFFMSIQSKNIDSLCAPWPFCGYTIQKDPQYKEYRYFWPLFVQGRGEKRYINRWAPFYTHSITKLGDKTWRMWPLMKTLKWDDPKRDLRIVQEQFLYFFVWSQKQYSISNPDLPCAEKTHLWPLYSYWNNGAGKSQFQMFSPFEVFFPTSDIVRKLYTPLFALYRYEQTEPGHYEQSLLFNLVNYKKTPKTSRLSIYPFIKLERDLEKKRDTKIDILKGLYHSEKVDGRRKVKLCWIPITGYKKRPR